MRKSFKKSIAILSAAVILPVLAFAPTASAATSTIIITGNTAAGENQPGWLFNRDTSTSTPYEFNEDQASIGEGSLYVKPITNTLGTPGTKDKFIAENFINTAITNIDTISYDFRIGSGGDNADAGQFYMNVYANFGESDDLKFYDCRYDVVPTVGSTGGFTTVTFDPTQAYTVTTRTGTSASPHTCPAVPADMDTLSPGSNIRMFSLNVGDAGVSGSDTGLDGYLDNVIVTTTADTTTYDFEAPLTVLANKDACKNGGWATSEAPVFKNQGDCVSSFASNGKAKGDPPIVNGLRF